MAVRAPVPPRTPSALPSRDRRTPHETLPTSDRRVFVPWRLPLRRFAELTPYGISRFSIRNVALQFLDPRARVAVGRCAPIAARREASAGNHLRPVGQCRALELAQLEEAVEEDAEPLLDLGQRVGVARVLGKPGRPVAARCIAPRVPREKRDLRRTQSVTRDVEEIEVLQLVGPDL